MGQFRVARVGSRDVFLYYTKDSDLTNTVLSLLFAILCVCVYVRVLFVQDAQTKDIKIILH